MTNENRASEDQNINEENIAMGRRLREIRKKIGVSQMGLGEQLGISVPGVSDLENGKYRPGHDFLRNIALHYNVNLY